MNRSRSLIARWARRGLVVACAALLVGSIPVAPASAQGADDDPTGGPSSVDVAALREQYEELVGAETDLLVQYDLAAARLLELVPEVQQAREAVDRADTAVVEAQVALAESREVEADADAAAADARDEVARAEERLRTYAVETYMDVGDTEALGAVFDTSAGSDDSLARRGYRQTVSDQQRDLIDDLIDARTRSRQVQDRARRAAAAAATQREQVDDLRRSASEALDTSTALVVEVAAERDRQEALLIEVRSRKVSIEARITSLEKAADGIAALLAAFQGDEEDWVAGVVDVRIPREGGVISSEFGQRAHPILSITRLHAGADIGAPSGSPVLAAANGIVLAAEARGGYGNTVVLAHGSSLSTVYAHNTSFTVEVGQIVEQGDVIALAGSTGLSTGSHIHFETRLKGTPVNPRSILAPGDATWGKADADGDGIRNIRDVDPANPDVPVADGDEDEDGDGQPNGGDELGEALQPR